MNNLKHSNTFALAYPTTLLSPPQPSPPPRPTHLLVPKSAPTTVTLPPPVVPSFTVATLDTELTSYDALVVIDPASDPAVIATTRLCPTPAPALHTTTVSDVHDVA